MSEKEFTCSRYGLEGKSILDLKLSASAYIGGVWEHDILGDARLCTECAALLWTAFEGLDKRAK